MSSDGCLNAPTCTPTRAALITGRYQQRVGLEEPLKSIGQVDRDRGLLPSQTSLPALLKTKGYTTALVGKWHLGFTAPRLPGAHGFDFFWGFLSGAVDFYAHSDRTGAPDLYEGLTTGAGLACVIASALAGLVTLALEWRERFEIARYSAAVAVAAIVAGWAFAQEPYILPPDLTVRAAAAPDSTLTALLIAATVGIALLLPALAWLFRLALSGRLAYEEEPRP